MDIFLQWQTLCWTDHRMLILTGKKTMYTDLMEMANSIIRTNYIPQPNNGTPLSERVMLKG